MNTGKKKEMSPEELEAQAVMIYLKLDDFMRSMDFGMKLIHQGLDIELRYLEKLVELMKLLAGTKANFITKEDSSTEEKRKEGRL